MNAPDRGDRFAPGVLWSFWALLELSSLEFTNAVRVVALAAQSLAQVRHDLAKDGITEVFYEGPRIFWEREILGAIEVIQYLSTELDCSGSLLGRPDLAGAGYGFRLDRTR